MYQFGIGFKSTLRLPTNANFQDGEECLKEQGFLARINSEISVPLC
jgi:hypothetical protein